MSDIAAPRSSTRARSLKGGGRNRSGQTNFELYSWLFMRLSGLALVVLVLGHLFVNLMLGGGITALDFAFVAGKWANPSNEEICVFLMGSGMAPQRELAEAIAKQRRGPSRGGKVILIPIDARDWDAHLPTDAPAVAKNLLAKLRGGQ